MSDPEISSGRDARSDTADSLGSELETARNLLKQLLNVLDQTAAHNTSEDHRNV